MAAESGVRIYTIGIGGGQVGVRTPFGMRLLRRGGDLDPQTLQAIAQATGGRFFQATDANELERTGWTRHVDRLPPCALYYWPTGVTALASSTRPHHYLVRLARPRSSTFSHGDTETTLEPDKRKNRGCGSVPSSPCLYPSP